MKRSEVIRLLHAQIDDLLERYPISALYLFGSVARDEALPSSDVDLLVEFDQPVGLFQFIALQQELEKILGCQVDLGTPRSLKIDIKDEASAEVVRVVEVKSHSST